MQLEDYNCFCASLPHATHVVQWGGAHVWKVGGKVFAIGGPREGGTVAVSFKCSDIAYEVLREQQGLRPASYLASRGMKWIQRQTDQSMDDTRLKEYLAESHRIVSAGLPKRLKKELGML